MGNAKIPVDLRNPGQVFACLGFMEAAEILCGPCEGRFAYTGAETLTHFEIATKGDAQPVEEVLRFLSVAKVEAIAPAGSELSAEKWSVSTRLEASAQYPFEPPDGPDKLAVLLFDDRGRRVPIEHWGDSPRTGRDNVKFWAGAGGYPGAAFTRDALSLLQGDRVRTLTNVAGDPLNLSLPQKSSFRFDWRRDYVPLDVGFSPNEHSNVTMMGFPLVEVLAAIGLQHARPARPNRRDKLTYRYGVSNANLPTAFARVVLGGQSIAFPTRTFLVRLGWPGKEGQARCIIDTREETSK